MYYLVGFQRLGLLWNCMEPFFYLVFFVCHFKSPKLLQLFLRMLQD